MAVKGTAEKKAGKGGNWINQTHGEPVTLQVDGSLDIRLTMVRNAPANEETAKQFKMEVGKFGQWKIAVETSADGKSFRKVGNIHPAVLAACSAEEAQALLVEGAWEEGTGNFLPPEPEEKKPAKVSTKKKGK